MLHGDLLGERARLTPDKTALVFVPTAERFTYRELDRRAGLAAAAWTGPLGLKPGDRIGLLSHNRPEFLDCFFAAGKSGVIVVPLGTRLTPHELAHVVRDSGLRIIIYDPALADTVRGLQQLVTIDRWVSLDDEWASVVGSVQQPLARTAISPEDPYCLLYTSGTTGKPKGVIVPHRMVSWNGMNTACGWQLREDDVSPIFTPLYHAGGLGAFLTPIIAIGGTIVLHAGFDASEIWRTIEKEGCTVVLGVPTIWKLLMEAPEFATADLSKVRWFISGGAPLPLYIIEAYHARGVVFRQGYGLTEVGVNCFAMTDADSVRKKGSIGRPLMFTEARVVDASGRDAAAGEVGELWLRGPHVSKGYWNNPEATAAALDAEGWFHTGDSARCDEEGFFFIAGRKRDMFISGGVNVYPAEIEGELLLHPDVRDAAVIGVPHDTWGEVGVAFVVPRSAGAATGEALTEFLSRRLAKFKIPREFVFVDALPRTPYGKVVKAELQQAYQKGPAGTRSASDTPGGTGMTRILAHRIDGSGEPLLLLNGGMMSIAAWDPIAIPLASRYRVIRCDFRGQLLSPGEPHADLAGHAGDLVALLDGLGIDAAHVIGASFGAEVGVVLAAMHPSRVRSLIAATPFDHATDDMRAGAQRVRDVCRDAAAGGDGGRMIDVMLDSTYSEAYRTANAAMLASRRSLVGALPRSWFAGIDGILAVAQQIDLRPLLHSVVAPALVVVAGRDRTAPPEQGRAVAAGIPGTRLLELPDAAHAFSIEDPQRFVDICLDFLGSLPSGGRRPPGT